MAQYAQYISGLLKHCTTTTRPIAAAVNPIAWFAGPVVLVGVLGFATVSLVSVIPVLGGSCLHCCSSFCIAIVPYSFLAL